MKEIIINIKNTIKEIIFRNQVIAVVKLQGVIGSAGGLKTGLTLDTIDEKIEEAFKIYNLKAVALLINSPGGSPVQSELIFKRIRNLAEEKNILVLSFIEDCAASGGYWLACAGDKIYAAQNSIIGSIGVISAGFGFSKAIEKLGVERRVYTEGNSKSILDPFMPEKQADIEILKDVQRDVYENFKNLVLARRAEINKKDHKTIFSGAFWSSKNSKELGLIDEINDFYTVIHAKFGKEVKIKKINFQKSRLKSLLGGVADSFINSILTALDEKFIKNKFGL